MLHSPKFAVTPLTKQLKESLVAIRKKRAFNSNTYVSRKANLLNSYFNHANLSAAVVAVSGGIDSAAVLAIVAYAAKQPNSPIKSIVPVLLPATNNPGVTNQDKATSAGLTICRHLELTPVLIDVTNATSAIQKIVETALNSQPPNIGPIEPNIWARGQLVPYTRTPILYYVCTLLTQKGIKSVICGTTNKDEGAYLGYVGKASDAMVDLQLISDLHKSEVYSVAAALKLPKMLISRTPTGDMYDARSDEELFGASYDFVELYLTFLTWSKSQQATWLTSLDSPSKELFEQQSANLELLHSYNAHKYLAQSQAIHLDLIQNKVPGNWGAPNNNLLKLIKKLRK